MTDTAALHEKRRRAAYRGAGIHYEAVARITSEDLRHLAAQRQGPPVEPTPERLGKALASEKVPAGTTLATRVKSPVEAHADQFETHLLQAAAWWTAMVWAARRAQSPRISRYNDAPRGTRLPEPQIAASTLHAVRAKLRLEEAMLECAEWMAEQVIDQATGRQPSLTEFAAKYLTLRDASTRRGFTLGLMRATLERLYGLMVIERALR